MVDCKGVIEIGTLLLYFSLNVYIKHLGTNLYSVLIMNVQIFFSNGWRIE